MALTGRAVGTLGALLGAGYSDESDAAFIGQLAKTFNKDALKLAQKMQGEGATRDEIWKATTDKYGAPTFQGFDEKWRQEIPDTGASLKTDDIKQALTLDDLIEHPELFKSYPDLKDIQISNNKIGDYYTAGNPDLINISSRSEERLTPRLLHEIQHAIQNKERFSQGGNPRLMPDDFNPENKAVKDINDFIKSSMRSDFEIKSMDDLKKILDGETNLFSNNQLDRELTKSEYHKYGLDLSDLDEGGIGQEAHTVLDDLVDKLQIETEDWQDQFGNYERMPGEVEARNVETRYRNPNDIKNENPPWKTQDINERFVREPDYPTIPTNQAHRRRREDFLKKLDKKRTAEREQAYKEALFDSWTTNRNPQIQGASVPMAGTIADLIYDAERNAPTPLNYLVPTGTADWLRKLQYDDDITWLDRILANPAL